MTINILDDYRINRFTMAMVPVAHTDYYTVVFEGHNQFYVKKTVLELLRPACIRGGASLEGRQIAVTHITGFDRKIPIPINPIQNIYAFPTHSPKNFDCCWLFPLYIDRITPHPIESEKSTITFKNRRTITLSTATNILLKQMLRTSFCILQFSREWAESSRYEDQA